MRETTRSFGQDIMVLKPRSSLEKSVSLLLLALSDKYVMRKGGGVEREREKRNYLIKKQLFAKIM